MAKLRFGLTVAALIPLSACAVYTAHEQLEALNHAVPNGSQFTNRLTVEYRDLANQDNDKFDDYVDADRFSRKGLISATSKITLPENPTDWSLPDGVAGIMLQSRKELIDLLDNGGRKGAPEFAAVAQARFDCWVQRSAKDANGNDAAVCRAQFEEALAQARAAMAAPAAPTPPPPPEDELHAARFLVFFDWNKATITASGQAVIATAISEAQRLGATRIDVVGNADLSGTERYNQKLSLQRALAVKQALVRHGIPVGEIDTSAHGDDTPLVPTGRGVREPANRRVEIHFE